MQNGGKFVIDKQSVQLDMYVTPFCVPEEGGNIVSPFLFMIHVGLFYSKHNTLRGAKLK